MKGYHLPSLFVIMAFPFTFDRVMSRIRRINYRLYSYIKLFKQNGESWERPNMKKSLLLLIVVAALVFGAMNYHFILLDDSIKILKKADLAFDNTFVDARGVKRLKLITDPALVKSGIKNLIDDESLSIPK